MGIHKDNVMLMVRKWLNDSYTIDLSDYAQAIRSEQARYKQIMQNANLSKASLLYCAKTGQPIGQLFDHVSDTYIAQSLAPNWVNTSQAALDAKMTTQPCALLVYFIERTCLAGGSLQKHIDNGNMHTLQVIETANALRAELYERIVSLEPRVIMSLFYMFNDAHKFLRYAEIAENHLKRIGLALFEAETDDLRLITMTALTAMYAGFLESVITPRELQGVATLETSDFVAQVERFLEIAAKRIVSKRENPLTMQQILTLPMHNRITRRNPTARATFDMAQAMLHAIESGSIKTIKAADIGFRDLSAIPDAPKPAKTQRKSALDAFFNKGE